MIVAILSAIVIIAYIISAVYLLIAHPTDTYIISQGTITQEDENVGYIIRDEKVEKNENYKELRLMNQYLDIIVTQKNK